MSSQWWKSAVVYQIYPRSFYDANGDGIGDLKGICKKLDYLVSLGVDVLWLSPVYKSPNDDNGYDISDYMDIMDDFGTMEDFDCLLEAMHQRGLKLVMDLVVNHSSDEHHWFTEGRKSKDNPYRDYYIWRKGIDGKPPTDWKACFGGSAWEYDNRTEEYYLHMFSKKQPDLNWENPKVREEIYAMMKFWLDKGVDGFRMDVINMISKRECLSSYEAYEKGAVRYRAYSPNGAMVHEILKEMNEKVLSNYDIMTVGECPGVTPEMALLYTDVDRKELNMVFQFEHMELDQISGKEKWDLKPLDLRDLKENLSKWQTEMQERGWNSLYWNNHDQPRIVSRFGNDGKYRVLSAKMLATVLHMMKGTPYIYQGEEIGMTNVRFPTIDKYRDIETLNMYQERLALKDGSLEQVMASIHSKGRDNARTPMQWNREKNAGFTEHDPWIEVNPNYTVINVEEALNDRDSIFYYYQQLIRLRKEYEIIVEGSYELLSEGHEQVFAYCRKLGEDLLLVVANFSGDEVDYPIPSEMKTDQMKPLIHNYDGENVLSGKVRLRPYEAIVLSSQL